MSKKIIKAHLGTAKSLYHANPTNYTEGYLRGALSVYHGWDIDELEMVEKYAYKMFKKDGLTFNCLDTKGCLNSLKDLKQALSSKP